MAEKNASILQKIVINEVTGFSKIYQHSILDKRRDFGFSDTFNLVLRTS